MKDIVPLLVKMQENKNKPSMHKKGYLESYFSYADLSGKKISLLPFPQTNFKIIDTDTISPKLASKDKDIKILALSGKTLKVNDKLVVRDSIGGILKGNKISSQIKNEQNKDPVLILKYSGETLYQDYLSIKAILHENEIITSSTEYLLTVK